MPHEEMEGDWDEIAMPVARFLSDIPIAKELFGKLNRDPRPPKPRYVSSGRAHRVLWNGNRWRCIQCARCFNGKRAPGICAVLTPALKGWPQFS